MANPEYTCKLPPETYRIFPVGPSLVKKIKILKFISKF